MLTLTEAASKKLREVVAEQAEPVFGLRVSVCRGDCKGYQYEMSLVPAPTEGDWIADFGGVRVLVDPESASLLEGIEIDYVETPECSGFAFLNPRGMRGCRCGFAFDAGDPTEDALAETDDGPPGRSRGERS